MKPKHSPSLVEGLRHSEEMVVKESDLDTYWKIGNRMVLAIPVIIGFIEHTTGKLLLPYLDQGFESIGMELNLKHSGQAHLGEKVYCNIHLKFIDEDNLFLDISVLNKDHEEITHGAHERRIVAKNPSTLHS